MEDGEHELNFLWLGRGSLGLTHSGFDACHDDLHDSHGHLLKRIREADAALMESMAFMR